MTLTLPPEETKNLADYIRECEIEREVSEARADAVKNCTQTAPTEALSHMLIISVITAGLLGYLAGSRSR